MSFSRKVVITSDHLYSGLTKSYMYRYIFSAGLLVFSFVCTFYAILEQKTGFWKEVPGRDVNVFFQKNDRFVMKTTTKNGKQTLVYKNGRFFYESRFFMFVCIGHLNKHLTMLDLDLLLFCRLVLSLFDIPNIN